MAEIGDPILSKLSGEDFYDPLIRSFVKDLPRTYGELSTLLRAAEFREAKELCHQMSGTAATYGYPELGWYLETLEKLLKTGSPNKNEIESLSSKISESIQRIEAALIPIK